jgi:hypothetical protein
MTTPSIVQSAFARGSSSSLTATLGSSPTVGNMLLFVLLGDPTHGNTSSSPTSPSGVALYDSGFVSNYEQVFFYEREVQSGDGTSWTFTGIQDTTNLAIFEISNFSSTNFSSGACSGINSATLTTGSLASPADSACLRLLLVTWDNTVSATTPSGLPLLSPASWLSTSNSGHNAAIYEIPSSTTGTQSISGSGNFSYGAIYADLQISATIPVAPHITQTGAEVWGDNTAPPVHLTQAGAEVWGSNPSVTVHLTQVGAEVWLALNEPYAAPVIPPSFIVT